MDELDELDEHDQEERLLEGLAKRLSQSPGVSIRSYAGSRRCCPEHRVGDVVWDENRPRVAGTITGIRKRSSPRDDRQWFDVQLHSDLAEDRTDWATDGRIVHMVGCEWVEAHWTRDGE
jgi:hypothetical protein